MHSAMISLTACLMTSSAFANLPPAMTDLPLAQALKQNAADESELLIVKFTAPWCNQCKRMDSRVWSNNTVIDSLREQGVTVIAVDIEQHPDIALEHRVTSTPTLIAFRNGEPADLLSGSVRAPELLDWVGHVLDGRTHADMVKQQLNDRSEMSMRQRMMVASELMRDGKLNEATEEFLWLWEHMLEHETSMQGVRVSFMVSDMKKLASQHEPARKAFTALRDELTETMKNGDDTYKVVSDWLVLNIRLLEDHRAVAEWVDQIDGEDDGIETMREMGSILQDWLLDHGYYAQAGRMLRSAEAVIGRAHKYQALLSDEQRYDGMDEDSAARLKSRAMRMEIEKFARIHAAYLAADRPDDAWYIYDALLEDFDADSVGVSVCRAASVAGVLAPRHTEIAQSLDEWAHRETRQAVLGMGDE